MSRRAGLIAARSRGFTLIEIVTALVLFAVALGIFMQMTGNSLRATRQAQHYSHAALHAQSLLDAAGHGETLREGVSNGRLDDGTEWTLRVEKADVAAIAMPVPQAPSGVGTPSAPAPLPPAAGVQEDVPVELFRLDLTIRWDDGRGRREAEFSTLRAIQPGGT
jgi:general secretion pathway protein I